VRCSLSLKSPKLVRVSHSARSLPQVPIALHEYKCHGLMQALWWRRLALCSARRSSRLHATTVTFWNSIFDVYMLSIKSTNSDNQIVQAISTVASLECEKYPSGLFHLRSLPSASWEQWWDSLHYLLVDVFLQPFNFVGFIRDHRSKCSISSIKMFHFLATLAYNRDSSKQMIDDWWPEWLMANSTATLATSSLLIVRWSPVFERC